MIGKNFTSQSWWKITSIGTVLTLVMGSGSLFLFNPGTVHADPMELFFDDFDRTAGNTVGGEWMEQDSSPADEKISDDCHKDDHSHSVVEFASSGKNYAELRGDNSGEDLVDIDASISHDVPTLGFENITLEYWRAPRDIESSGNGQDRLLVEWRPGTSGDWNTLEDVSPDTGGNCSDVDFDQYSFVLSGAENLETIQIRFAIIGTGGNDRFLVDDVRVTGEELPETVTVQAFKYFDTDYDGEYNEETGDYPLENWEICLEGDGDVSPEECQTTDEDGFIDWEVTPDAEYEMWEELEDGWVQTAPAGDTYDIEVDGDGNVTYWTYDEEEGGWIETERGEFGNWMEEEIIDDEEDLDEEDIESPQSHFDDSLDHQIIDTEIVSLSLSGSSSDNVSGVNSAELSVWPIGDPDFDLLRIPPGDPDFDLLRGILGDPDFDLLNLYPGQSFFDIFYELQCPPQISEETVPIEIVSLSLTSVDPITVTWEPPVDWRWQPVPGVYCFEVKATDNAGNVEHTAWAGPLAYVPVPQISEESSSVGEIINNLVTLIVQWLTSHPATSRVVYDTVSHPVLGEAPNYGYALSTVEDSTLVTEHSVPLTGLLQGTTYYYRTVSHGSPENVGDEKTFGTPSQPVPPPSFSTLSPEPATSTPPSEPKTESENESTPPSEESGEVTIQTPPTTPGEPLPPQPPAENQQSSSPSGAPTTSPAPSTPGEFSEDGTIEESVAFGLEETVLPESTPGGVTVTTDESSNTTSNSLLASLVSILTPFQWLGVGALAALASLGGRRVWMKRVVKPRKPRKKS